MNRHAIFDLDGTLIDSARLSVEILNAMLADRGSRARVTLSRMRPYASLGGRPMVAAMLGEARGDADEDVAEFRTRYAALPTPPSSLYSGVRAGLSHLAGAGVRLALCSNKPQELCEKVVVDLALAEFFCCVVGARAGVPLKPDPALLDLALELSGGLAANSCYVGDSALDYEAACRAGLACVIVTYGYGDPRQDLPGAYRAETFSQAATTVDALLTAATRAGGLTCVA